MKTGDTKIGYSIAEISISPHKSVFTVIKISIYSNHVFETVMDHSLGQELVMNHSLKTMICMNT